MSVKSPPPPPVPMKATWRIMKNVVVVSLAFMLEFTANNGATNLQSSINAESGLGTIALAGVYLGLILSTLFLPPIFIRWLGCKWTIFLALITYMPYIAAQMWPTFWTLIPAGLLVGLGGGPLWCAKCTYLFMMAEMHSKISGVTAEALLSRFLGLFFMVFQFNQVWGNLISSLVLSGDNAAAVTKVNASMIPEVCGASFLPSADAGDALQQQPPHKMQMLAGIYLTCMVMACILVAFGLDSTKNYEESKTTDRSSSLALLAVTVKLFIEPTQLMLFMINVFSGLSQAFFSADFTAAFVSCAIGTGTVGFIMLTYGFSNAAGCVTAGYLAKRTGRLPLISTGLVTSTALYITMLLWKTQATDIYIMYLIAVVWGISDSMWVVQINAFYGILFPGREEAAFSNFRLGESVGYIIAYIVSPYFRTTHKIYLLSVAMIFGFILYVNVELRYRRRNKIGAEKSVSGLSGCDNVVFDSNPRTYA